MSKAKEVKGEKESGEDQEEESSEKSSKKDEKKEKEGNKGEKAGSDKKTEAKTEPTKIMDEKENGEFSAIEILVPKEELKKDKDLIKKI